MDESTQRNAKLEIVLSALEHMGRISREDVKVLPVLASPRSMGYRRRATLHFSRGALSFFGRKSHQAVAIERCPALVPLLEPLPGKLSSLLAPMEKDVEEVQLLAEGDRAALAISLRGSVKPKHHSLCERALKELGLRGVVLAPKTGGEVFLGKPVLKESQSPARYLRPDAFGQAHGDANPLLVDAALNALAVNGSDDVLELFSGNGNFSLPLAARAKAVVAVESSNITTELARRAAREANATNLTFIQGDARKVCEGLAKEGRRFDCLLLDPPRSGMPEVAGLVRQLNVARVVYVACDAAALARDAGRLKEAGFGLGTVQVVDMFPQTSHIETVMSFARSG